MEKQHRPRGLSGHLEDDSALGLFTGSGSRGSSKEDQNLPQRFSSEQSQQSQLKSHVLELPHVLTVAANGGPARRQTGIAKGIWQENAKMYLGGGGERRQRILCFYIAPSVCIALHREQQKTRPCSKELAIRSTPQGNEGGTGRRLRKRSEGTKGSHAVVGR